VADVGVDDENHGESPHRVDIRYTLRFHSTELSIYDALQRGTWPTNCSSSTALICISSQR
jgi:hypothetical protein